MNTSQVLNGSLFICRNGNKRSVFAVASGLSQPAALKNNRRPHFRTDAQAVFRFLRSIRWPVRYPSLLVDPSATDTSFRRKWHVAPDFITSVVVGNTVEKVRKNNYHKYLKFARLHRMRTFFGG
jgi:hypothetical protein